MNIPIWLAFALMSPSFWAIVHVLDSYCVEEVFDRPWVGIVTSGLTMLAVLPLLMLGQSFETIAPMSPNDLFLCLVCGLSFMASQWLYFNALAITESGIVAAYWNFIPMLLPVVSFFWLGEVLGARHYAGSAILVGSSVLFCLLDGDLKSRWSSFVMMFIGAWLQVAYFMIQKSIFSRNPVYQSFLVMTFAMGLAGLSPLLIGRFRRAFLANWPRIRPNTGIIFAIEIFNLIALGTSQYAVSHGSPSLVSAVEASIPAYTFVISLVLYAATRKFGEEEASEKIGVKLSLVMAMVFGVWVVS